MRQNNIVKDKSYAFAIRCVNLYRYLVEEKKEFVLSKQVLKSGTSIGANIEEARETYYWLRILRDTQFIEDKQAESLLKDIDELLKIIGTIQKTVKSKTSS